MLHIPQPRRYRVGVFFLLTFWFQAAFALTGTWTPLVAPAPGAVELMLLLSDGTVLCANNDDNTIGNGWFRLTPDSHGSYINGSWSAVASMHYTRLFYSSDVLRDGRVFVAGGEYGTGTATAEVYDPLSNTWTVAAIPASLLDPTQRSPLFANINQGFLDSISSILPNGNVLVSPVAPNAFGGTLIYNPASNTWSTGPTLFQVAYQDETSWVKLPDGSILTVDPFGSSTERYIPSLNQWVSDAVVPVALYSSLFELGPGLLLADGRAFYLGGSGHTAFYTPSGTSSPGTWTAGPNIPNGLGINDAPAAMMINGKILCAAGNATNFNAPTSFFEFDPVSNAFTSVSTPQSLTGIPPFQTTMLALPDGTILCSTCTSQIYSYQPSGAPLTAGKPTIGSVSVNPDGSYHLVGTLLNGISEGAAYGDDAQMSGNYPLVRLTNASGTVYYARTYNWSSTWVMTGNTPESTEFTLPGSLPAGNYSLRVSANGNSSDSIPFSLLIQNGGFETGDFFGWSQTGNFASSSVTTTSPSVLAGRYGAKLASAGSLISLSQTVTTIPGAAYLLSFWLNSPDGVTPNEFAALWNGGALFDQTNLGAIGWTNFQYIVKATNTSTVLQFKFRDDSSSLGFDAVTLTQVPVPAFQSVINTNGAVALTWSTLPGLSYQMLYNTNLLQTNWINLGAPIVATNSTASLADAIGVGPRFYRVKLLP